MVVIAVSVISGSAHVRAAFIWGRSMSPSAVLSAAVKRAARVVRFTVTLFKYCSSRESSKESTGMLPFVSCTNKSRQSIPKWKRNAFSSEAVVSMKAW